VFPLSLKEEREKKVTQILSDLLRFAQTKKYFLVGKSGERRGKAGNCGKCTGRTDGGEQRAEASGGGKRWKNMEERGKGAMSCGVTSG